MDSSRRSISLLLSLTLLLCQRSASANDTWPVDRGPSREPRPYRYDAKQWLTVPKEFLEDATACVLYAGNSYRIDPDGVVELTTHEVTRLNGRKAVEKLGEYRHITFDPSYQKLTLNEATLHKADGRQMAVAARHVQLRDVATDFQVYDREKQLIISFPDLEVGDTLEVKWTLRGKNPEHGGHFFTRYAFGDTGYPVARDELLVLLPANMPFKHACPVGRVEPVVAEEGGQRLYHWKAVNTPQLPQDDNLPSKEELRPAVVCSTFPSWEAIGQWKQKLRADSWQSSPEIRKVVRDSTKGLDDPAAKARALTYWMRRNIRYVSAGEKHDYTPHPPARVLANRYGDCKDTSQLLAVMLREAGLPVALATLGALDDGQVVEAVPSPWGTHAILYVPLAGGDHWIDTTLSLGGWDFLPREDRDRLCYIVDAEGRLSLKRTPPLTAEGNRYEQTTVVRIGADGSSRYERTTVAHGSAALGQRDNYVEAPIGERRRLIAAELQDANSKARLLQLSFNEAALLDFDRPVQSQLTFEVPGHFSGSPDLEGSITDSRVWGRLLSYNLDYDRQQPFNLPTPFESRHRYVVRLPAGFALESVPRDRLIASPWGRFEMRAAARPDKGPLREVELNFLTRIDKTRVEPAEFDEFRRFHEEVGKVYRAWLTLKPTADPSDLPLLEGILALAPDDSASAAALARLYRELGQASEAQRVLRRARHYRPDEATLWEMSARFAATADEEEEAQRELARRFPAEARHALALGALLVQRGKHGPARAVLEPLTRAGAPADCAAAHFQLARSAYRTDRAEDALKHWEAAAAAAPETIVSARALQLRGRICEDLGRLQDAALAYRQALAVERDAEDALNGLIRLALAVNNRVEARDYLRRYTTVVGDEVSGLLLAADYHLQLGQFEEAFELASKARDLRFHERTQRILGLVHLHRGEDALALRHLEKADADATVLEAMLRATLALGDLRALPARLEQAKKADKPTAELKRTIAAARAVWGRRKALARLAPPPVGGHAEWERALDRLACAEHARASGRLEVAQRLLAACFIGETAPGPAFALRGRLAADTGKLARAAFDSAKAIELSPLDGQGYYVRGRVRLERGEATAFDDLELAAELTNWQDADVLHGLADGLFRAGKLDGAMLLQQEAVRLKPEDREIREQCTAFEKVARQKGAGG